MLAGRKFGAAGLAAGDRRIREIPLGLTGARVAQLPAVVTPAAEGSIARFSAADFLEANTSVTIQEIEGNPRWIVLSYGTERSGGARGGRGTSAPRGSGRGDRWDSGGSCGRPGDCRRASACKGVGTQASASRRGWGPEVPSARTRRCNPRRRRSGKAGSGACGRAAHTCAGG